MLLTQDAKKAKKSIACKYKGSSRSEAEILLQSQNDPSELDDGITNTSTEAHMDMETNVEMEWSKVRKNESEVQMDTMESNAEVDWSE